MNFVTAKQPSDIKLAGISVHFEKVDDSLKVVTLSDGKGGVVRFNAGNYEAAKVTVPAPPKVEPRYVLRGEIPVIGAIEKVFEEKYEAESAKNELGSSIRGDAELTITKEDVEIKDETSSKASDDIPL